MARRTQQAVAFLERVLYAGPLPSQQAWEQAWQAGYSRRTYDRARKVLQVQAKRRGWGSMGQWELSLPPAKRPCLAKNRDPIGKRASTDLLSLSIAPSCLEPV
jgi:hypothetical protein